MVRLSRLPGMPELALIILATSAETHWAEEGVNHEDMGPATSALLTNRFYHPKLECPWVG